MKKIFAYISVILCLMLLFVTGCADTEKVEQLNIIKVVVNQSPCYSVYGGDVVYADETGTATFKLDMKDNNFVESVTSTSLIDSEFENFDDYSLITLKNLQWSVAVSINCRKSDAVVEYHLNGGNFSDGSANDRYKVYYDLKHHSRPNTEIGTNKFEREGYTLYGWNTTPDGSGTEIGLGSRVSIPENGKLDLYAMWSEQNKTDDFLCMVNSSNEAEIVRYLGDSRVVTVPEYAKGYPVTSIALNSFMDTDADKIILPKTIKRVESGAFKNCTFSELYMYDNVEEILDDSFISCKNFSTLHINAIQSPRFSKYDKLSNFTDKYDILIENEDKNKLLVFGGSGTYFSIDTKQIEKTYNDFVCINMGANAYFNGVAQFEMMLPYIGEGDVFIHAPEASAPQQFLYDISMYSVTQSGAFDTRIFSSLESNFDLLTNVDIRNVTDTFQSFTYFNSRRKSMAKVSYSDYISEIKYNGGVYETDTGYIDDRGNYAAPLPAGGDNAITGEADIVSDFLMDRKAMNRLNSYYDRLRTKGAKVFLINAAINEDILDKRINETDYEKFEKYPHGGGVILSKTVIDWVNDFDGLENRNISVPCILPLSDCLYTSDYFSTSDFHLSDYGREIHTQKIIDALGKVL